MLCGCFFSTSSLLLVEDGGRNIIYEPEQDSENLCAAVQPLRLRRHMLALEGQHFMLAILSPDIQDRVDVTSRRRKGLEVATLPGRTARPNWCDIHDWRAHREAELRGKQE